MGSCEQRPQDMLRLSKARGSEGPGDRGGGEPRRGGKGKCGKRKGSLRRKEGRGVGESPPPCSPRGCRGPWVCLQEVQGRGESQAVRLGEVSYHCVLHTYTCMHTHVHAHTCTHAGTHVQAHTRARADTGRFHCRYQVSAPTAARPSRWVPTEGRGQLGNQGCPASAQAPHPRGS